MIRKIQHIFQQLWSNNLLAIIGLFLTFIALLFSEIRSYDPWLIIVKPTAEEITGQIAVVCFCLLAFYLLSPILECLFPGRRIGNSGLINGILAGAIAGPIGCWGFISRAKEFIPVSNYDVINEYERRFILVTIFTALGGAVWGQVMQIYRHLGNPGNPDRLGRFLFFLRNRFTGLICIAITILSCSTLYAWKIQHPNHFLYWTILTQSAAIRYAEILLLPFWFIATITIINSFQSSRAVLFRLINYTLIPTMTSIGLAATILLPRVSWVNYMISKEEYFQFTFALGTSITCAFYTIAYIESAIKSKLETQLEAILEKEEEDMTVAKFRGRVDVLVVSVTADEQEAMQAKLAANAVEKTYSRMQDIYYFLYKIKTAFGTERTVLHMRLTDQGDVKAVHMVSAILGSFDPQLVLLVGIAGGVASSDFSLGDVLVSTSVVGLSRVKKEADGTEKFAPGGGPMSQQVQSFITSFVGNPSLNEWHLDIKMERPAIYLEKLSGRLEPTNTASLNSLIQRSIKDNLVTRPLQSSKWRPKIVEAITVSDSNLNRNPEIIERWKELNRKIANVDMECIGIYEATRDICPLLIIRGISDIVGLKRDWEDSVWTKYACEVSASFAYTLIEKEKMLPRKH